MLIDQWSRIVFIAHTKKKHIKLKIEIFKKVRPVLAQGHERATGATVVTQHSICGIQSEAKKRKNVCKGNQRASCN